MSFVVGMLYSQNFSSSHNLPSDFFKAAGMPLMYLPKNGDFNYLTQRRRMC